MSERDQGENRSWSKKLAIGLGALTVTAVAAGIPYGLAVGRNNEEMQAAWDAAKQLAPERHTCRITDAHHEPSDLGGPVLAVTVRLQDRISFDKHNQEFDRSGVDVTFEDTGKPFTGLRLLRLDPGDEATGPFVASASDTPERHEVSATFDEPLWRVDMNTHRYRVERRDAVRAEVRGWLVSDTDYVGITEPDEALNCGELTYTPKTDAFQIFPPHG